MTKALSKRSIMSFMCKERLDIACYIAVLLNVDEVYSYGMKVGTIWILHHLFLCKC